MNSSEGEAVKREVWIAASSEVVFEYLTNPAMLTRWLGIRAEVKAEPGGQFTIDVNGRDLIRGEYLEIEPPRRIVFTWGFEGGLPPAGSTTVEITLTPENDGTRVCLVHRGLEGKTRDAHAEGWTHYLSRLAKAGQGEDPGPDPRARPDYRHGAV